MKQKRRKIKEFTSYDFQTAQIIDDHCDFILAGDSLGNVFQGNETTLSVELEHMYYHGQIVGAAQLKNKPSFMCCCCFLYELSGI